MVFLTLPSVLSEHRGQITVQQADCPLLPGSNVTLSWSPADILPFQDPQSYTVDISLFTLDAKSGDPKRANVLATDYPNSGTASITIPKLSLTKGAVATPLYFQVEAAKLDYKHKRQVGLVISGIVRSRVNYLIRSAIMRLACEIWARTQPDGQMLLDQVEPCPCTVRQAQAHSNFKEEISDIFGIRVRTSKVFHPDADRCYRQRVPK